jgi:predicted HicB family RNase H-like nuclease
METSALTAEKKTQKPRHRDPDQCARVNFQVRMKTSIIKKVNAAAKAAGMSRNEWLCIVAETATEV